MNADPHIQCWEGSHRWYALVAFLAVGLYFPSATCTPFQVLHPTDDLDIQYAPIYIMVVQLTKFILLAAATLLSNRPLLFLVLSFLLNTFLVFIVTPRGYSLLARSYGSGLDGNIDTYDEMNLSNKQSSKSDTSSQAKRASFLSRIEKKDYDLSSHRGSRLSISSLGRSSAMRSKSILSTEGATDIQTALWLRYTRKSLRDLSLDPSNRRESLILSSQLGGHGIQQSYRNLLQSIDEKRINSKDNSRGEKKRRSLPTNKSDKLNVLSAKDMKRTTTFVAYGKKKQETSTLVGDNDHNEQTNAMMDSSKQESILTAPLGHSSQSSMSGQKRIHPRKSKMRQSKNEQKIQSQESRLSVNGIRPVESSSQDDHHNKRTSKFFTTSPYNSKRSPSSKFSAKMSQYSSAFSSMSRAAVVKTIMLYQNVFTSTPQLSSLLSVLLFRKYLSAAAAWSAFCACFSLIPHFLNAFSNNTASTSSWSLIALLIAGWIALFLFGVREFRISQTYISRPSKVQPLELKPRKDIEYVVSSSFSSPSSS